MSPTLAEQPSILHALPGRLRVRLPARPGWDGFALEQHLRHAQGVRSIRINPLTGNVLIHFDPNTTCQDRLLAALGGGEKPLPRPQPQSPATPANSAAAKDRSRLAVRDGVRLGRTALALSRLTAGQLAGRHGLFPCLRGWAVVLEALAWLQELPVVRRTLAQWLGPQTAELLRKLTGLLAALLGGNPISFVRAAFTLLPSSPRPRLAAH